MLFIFKKRWEYCLDCHRVDNIGLSLWKSKEFLLRYVPRGNTVPHVEEKEVFLELSCLELLVFSPLFVEF